SLDPALVRPLAERLRGAGSAGRERELAWIESQLARKSGRPRVLVIAGGAGIGKTTVMRELARRLVLDGGPVIQLACAELAGAGAGALALGRCLAAASGSDAESASPVADLFAADAPPPRPADLDRLVNASIAWLQAPAIPGAMPR